MTKQQPVKYRAVWEMEEAAFCCGVREAGGLNILQVNPMIPDWYSGIEKPNSLYETASTSQQGLWADELPKIRQTTGARPIMFNLVVGKEGTEELRTLLNEQEDCFHVHTWRNPGTGAFLEMYVLTNGSSEDNTDYIEDDSDDDY